MPVDSLQKQQKQRQASRGRPFETGEGENPIA